MSWPAARRLLQDWWPLSLLCVIGGARLIVADNLPQALPTTGSLAVACGLATVVSAGYSYARHASPITLQGGMRAVVAGACLSCGPQLAVLLQPHDLAGSDLLLAGCLVPVSVAVTLSTRQESSGIPSRLLWAGIAAAASLLLMFPEPRLYTVRGVMTLVLLPALTGAGAVLFAEEARRYGGWWVTYSLCGGLIAHLLACIAQGHGNLSLSWSAAVGDLAVLACTILCLLRLGSVRYSAYFLLLPLLLLAYGVAVLQLPLSVRMVSGLLLLVGSAVVLLLPESRDDVSSKRRLII